MCCLFGFYDYGGTLSAKQKNRIISALAISSEIRGTDATGIAYRTGTKLCIYKRPFPARWMRFRLPAEVKAVMGHTRMTTQGSICNERIVSNTISLPPLGFHTAVAVNANKGNV